MKHDNKFFDSEVEEYEDWFRENDKLLESELEAVRQLLPETGQGVEIGVGTGIFASRLGIREGVDPSPGMLEEAAKRGINTTLGFAESLPFKERTYGMRVLKVLCKLQR